MDINLFMIFKNHIGQASISIRSAGLSINGYELHWANAHIFVPLSILKYPPFPQVDPQEFFTFQKSFPLSFPYPVASTAWLTS